MLRDEFALELEQVADEALDFLLALLHTLGTEAGLEALRRRRLTCIARAANNVGSACRG
jgi:hypothetical protein